VHDYLEKRPAATKRTSGRSREQAAGTSAALLIGLQRTAGNRAVQRLLAKLTAPPPYKDGLTLAKIKSDAVDKDTHMVPDGKPWRYNPSVATDWDGGANSKRRSFMKKAAGDDRTQWHCLNPVFLQIGEIHGNAPFMNKQGKLPGATTYTEYDIAKYTGEPDKRGGERIVVGADGTHYYTSDHYENFAPFDS
jgi:ribonuclease